VRGLMEAAVQGDQGLRALNALNTADSYVDALRTRLFLSASNGQSQVHLQFMLAADAREEFRVYGAYLLHRVFEERELFVAARGGLCQYRRRGRLGDQSQGCRADDGSAATEREETSSVALVWRAARRAVDIGCHAGLLRIVSGCDSGTPLGY